MRIGIAVRLLGIIALVAFVGLQGSALKTRAFDGKTSHYTVVLKNGENASLISSEHKEKGVHVEHLSEVAGESGYVANMPADVAQELLSDSRVAYVALDGTMTVHHSWWETMRLTITHLVS